MSDFQASYGQVTIHYHKVSLDETAEKHGTEERIIFVRSTFTVEGVVFGPAAGAQTQTGFANAWDDVRKALWIPRQTLLIKAAGKTLVDHSGDDDLDFGPKPKAVSVKAITGGLSALVTFQVEIARAYGATPSRALGFVARTFTESLQIDDRFMTTRLIKGTVRHAVAGAVGRDPREIDRLHPRLRGFKRTRKWDFSRTQSSTDYELVDRELYQTFPRPITNGDATFTMTRQDDPDGKKPLTILEFSGWYEAPRGVSKQEVLSKLLALAFNRVKPFGANSAFRLKGLSAKESIFSGRMQVDARSEGKNVDQRGFDHEVQLLIGRDVPYADAECEDRGALGTASVSPQAPAGGAASSGSNSRSFGASVNLSGLWGAPTSQLAELQVIRHYRTRWFKVLLKPARAGASDVDQEVANPTVTLTELGRAQFIGELPADFIPALEGSMRVEELIVDAPYEDVAGAWIYPVRWVRRSVLVEGGESPALARTWAKGNRC